MIAGMSEEAVPALSLPLLPFEVVGMQIYDRCLWKMLKRSLGLEVRVQVGETIA